MWRRAVNHGAGPGRRNVASGFSKCRIVGIVPDIKPPETRSCSAGCCGGHHRGQLWTGERLDPDYSYIHITHFSSLQIKSVHFNCVVVV